MGLEHEPVELTSITDTIRDLISRNIPVAPDWYMLSHQLPHANRWRFRELLSSGSDILSDPKKIGLVAALLATPNGSDDVKSLNTAILRNPSPAWRDHDLKQFCRKIPEFADVQKVVFMDTGIPEDVQERMNLIYQGNPAVVTSSKIALISEPHHASLLLWNPDAPSRLAKFREDPYRRAMEAVSPHESHRVWRFALHGKERVLLELLYQSPAGIRLSDLTTHFLICTEKTDLTLPDWNPDAHVLKLLQSTEKRLYENQTQLHIVQTGDVFTIGPACMEKLTPRELKFLALLTAHPEQPMDIDTLVYAMVSPHLTFEDAEASLIWMISAVRKKMEAAGLQGNIINIKGFGYMFTEGGSWCSHPGGGRR